ARRPGQPATVLPAALGSGAPRWPGDEPWHHVATYRWPAGGPWRRRVHRPLRIPPRRAAASGEDRRLHQRIGAGNRRRGEPAPALRAHAGFLEPAPGSQPGRSPAAGPRARLAHLAGVPGRLRLWFPPQLDQPAPDPGDQATRGRLPRAALVARRSVSITSVGHPAVPVAACRLSATAAAV